MTAIRVRHRDDLLTQMRKQREALGFTHLEMDERIGLGSGHYGKIERMGASWGKQAFKMTASIVNALDLLGLELVVAPKGELNAETVPRDVRLTPPPAAQPRPSNVVPLRSMSASPGMIAEWRRARAGSKKMPDMREACRA